MMPVPLPSGCTRDFQRAEPARTDPQPERPQMLYIAARHASARFLLIDPQPMFRHGLCTLLQRLGEVTCREAVSWGEALALGDEAFDLILLDPAADAADGMEGLRRLRESWPHTPVVLMTAQDHPTLMVEGIRRGAAGFLPKSANPGVVLGAVQVVLAGGTYLPSSVVASSPLRGDDHGRRLTPRQRAVLALLGEGRSNKEIAEALGMQLNTVRVHVAAILRALGAESRFEAARLALSLRVVP